METKVEKRKREKIKMQSWSLNKKIKHAKKRIKEFHKSVNGLTSISFSGGKDSVVLRHLVLQLYPDTPVVFSNTTTEYIEILNFVRRTPNVIWVNPKKDFKTTLQKYGFPLVSKKVARNIRVLKNPTEKNKNHHKLLLTGITSTGNKAPTYMIAKKWRFLKDETFDLTDKCCDVLKKEPMNRYLKNTGRFPYIGTQASESDSRSKNWINYGCNIISDKTKKSRPISIWNESDVWAYIHKYKLEYCEIYDDVIDPNTGKVLITGEKRTGCAYCPFGANLEKGNTNRFQRLSLRKPKQFEAIMNIENNGVRFEDALRKVEVEPRLKEKSNLF